MVATTNEKRILDMPVTQSYTVTVRITDWVKREAKRRTLTDGKRVSGSEVVREILEKEIADSQEAIAA